jgi:uncharacterized protein (TIGR04255 family)
LSLNLSPINSSLTQKQKLKWIFENKKHTKKVSVSENSFVIEYFEYHDFNEFFETTKFLFDEFTKTYPIGVFKIKLRYINEITDTGNYREWDGLIDSNLITISKEFVEDNTDILNSLHNLEIKEESYNLKFNFGLHNSNYPAEITDKIFILDYECVTADDVEKADVYNNIKQYNQIITNWFEKSIGDNLRRKMGVNL